MDSAVDSIARSLTRIKKSTKKVQNGKMKALGPGSAFVVFHENRFIRKDYLVLISL